MERPVSLLVKVWGDYACFTRPEMKVERVSYPTMTPSAARGIMESILWKPEFNWHVKEIWTLNPIRYFSIRRNEINSTAKITVARRWATQGGGYFADDVDNRAQRHTLALREVAYLIFADISLRTHVVGKVDVAKYRAQFRRRVHLGQCFARPYLGCREFAANFGEPDGNERPIDHSDDFGLMLFDLDYPVNGTGSAQPQFFRAKLDGGVLHVPAELYAQGG